MQRALASQGGSLWSMSVNAIGTLIALGCEDGCIRLVSIAGGTFDHYRRFDRVNCRLLSLAWGPIFLRHENDRSGPTAGGYGNDEAEKDVWEDLWLISGNSDSSLIKWDYKTGRSVNKMIVGHQRKDDALVWAVVVLRYSFITLSSTSLSLLTLDQGWYDSFGRFYWSSQVLGLSYVHTDTMFPSARR